MAVRCLETRDIASGLLQKRSGAKGVMMPPSKKRDMKHKNADRDRWLSGLRVYQKDCVTGLKDDCSPGQTGAPVGCERLGRGTIVGTTTGNIKVHYHEQNKTSFQ